MVRLLTRRRSALGVSLAAGALLGLGATPAVAVDAGHGKAVFSQMCATCHSAAKDGATILGPDLYGVVGRKAGSVSGFNYSAAMKAAGFDWSNDKLHTYLQGPREMLPGVRMSFLGLKNPSQLDDLIAYLDTLK